MGVSVYKECMHLRLLAGFLMLVSHLAFSFFPQSPPSQAWLPAAIRCDFYTASLNSVGSPSAAEQSLHRSSSSPAVTVLLSLL